MEVLNEELKARGWTWKELKKRSGLPAPVVGCMLNGGTPITWRLANGLSRALGTSIDIWMNLQTSYEMALYRDEIQRDERE